MELHIKLNNPLWLKAIVVYTMQCVYIIQWNISKFSIFQVTYNGESSLLLAGLLCGSFSLDYLVFSLVYLVFSLDYLV